MTSHLLSPVFSTWPFAGLPATLAFARNGAVWLCNCIYFLLTALAVCVTSKQMDNFHLCISMSLGSIQGSEVRLETFPERWVKSWRQWLGKRRKDPAMPLLWANSPDMHFGVTVSSLQILGCWSEVSASLFHLPLSPPFLSPIPLSSNSLPPWKHCQVFPDSPLSLS